MITIVQGRLGSGKSYYLTQEMLRHLEHGGAVRTNIALRAREYLADIGRRVPISLYGNLSVDSDPREIPTGDLRGHGPRRCMVVLDEALNWFSGGKASDPRAERWGEWLRQSDKLGQDVYFVAQNFSRAAKWIRDLAQYGIEMIPLRHVHWMGIYWFNWGAFRGVYVIRKWDVRSGYVVSVSVGKYSSLWWRYYDTAETFGFRAVGSAYDGLTVYPRHRAVWVAPLLAIVSGLSGLAYALAV